MEYNLESIKKIGCIINQADDYKTELNRFFCQAAQNVFGHCRYATFSITASNNAFAVSAFDSYRMETEELDTVIILFSDVTTVSHVAKIWHQDLKSRQALKELERKKMEEEQEKLDVEREKDLLKELLEKHGNPNNDNPAPGEIPY